MKYYKAETVQTAGGAKLPSGYFVKWYELRLFGGMIKAQHKKSRNHKPIVLARRLHGDMVNDKGPLWMHDLAKRINELQTYDPTKLMEFLKLQKVYDPTVGSRMNAKSIVLPTIEQIMGNGS